MARASAAVEIEAPARLHFGFLDPSGGLGRRFAGLGLAIEGVATELRLKAASRSCVRGPESARVRALLARFAGVWRLPPVEIEVVRAIPAHAGLGSGTQLALALGRALSTVAGIDVGTAAIAAIAGRGSRSGIGIAVFEAGGFVLDGGRGEEGEPPPVLARLEFPPAWRLLLVLDRARSGLAGEAERQAFARLAPFPGEWSAQLCRLALLRLLPGVARADFGAASRGLGEIQELLGAWYAPVQGGSAFSSPAVAEVVAWLKAQGLEGIGQSSWGPTAFALVPDEVSAARLAAQVRRRFGARRAELEVLVVAGRNRGARLRCDGAEEGA
ncbi:4-diphosphocytidyl-2-C-methyl-D-erythritol kinase [bacterium HR40]|nr:4-diphosphocytidyl-2-C-methyl-D-erythritol kinase [bacterium HR40]